MMSLMLCFDGFYEKFFGGIFARFAERSFVVSLLSAIGISREELLDKLAFYDLFGFWPRRGFYPLRRLRQIQAIAKEFVSWMNELRLARESREQYSLRRFKAFGELNNLNEIKQLDKSIARCEQEISLTLRKITKGYRLIVRFEFKEAFPIDQFEIVSK